MDKHAFLTPETLDIERFVALGVAEGRDGKVVRAKGERCKHIYNGTLDCNKAYELYSCFAKEE